MCITVLTREIHPGERSKTVLCNRNRSSWFDKITVDKTELTKHRVDQNRVDKIKVDQNRVDKIKVDQNRVDKIKVDKMQS